VRRATLGVQVTITYSTCSLVHVLYGTSYMTDSRCYLCYVLIGGASGWSLPWEGGARKGGREDPCRHQMHRPACASISRWSHIIPSCIIAAYPACIKPPTSSSQPSPTSSQSHRSTSYSLINPCSSPPPSQLHNPMHAVMRLPPSDWREEHRQLRQRHHQYSETQATAASTVPVQSQSSLLLRRPASSSIVMRLRLDYRLGPRRIASFCFLS
jgi:hypothetical protein